MHIKRASRCWLELSDCSGQSVSPHYPCDNFNAGKKTAEVFMFPFLKARTEV